MICDLFSLCVLAASIKFHKIRHWPHVIKLFGAPANYNAETWESAHRWYVKRWLGKLQHCNESSNKSLLRRTTVANSHGGATQLEHPQSLYHLRKHNYAVRGKLPVSGFKSVYLLRYNVWVNVGQYVILSVPGVGGSPQVSLVVTIQRSGSGVLMTLQRLRRSPTQSILSRWA